MSRTFRDFMRQDVDNLLFDVSMEEAASPHNVEGRELPVIVDDERLTELKAKSRYADGIGTATTLIFIRAADLGYRPANGAHFELDGSTYRVVSVAGDLVLEIVLEENC